MKSYMMHNWLVNSKDNTIICYIYSHKNIVIIP